MSILSRRTLQALERFKQRGYETVSFTELQHEARDYMTDKLLESKLLRSGYSIRKTVKEIFVILHETPTIHSCELKIAQNTLFEA